VIRTTVVGGVLVATAAGAAGNPVEVVADRVVVAVGAAVVVEPAVTVVAGTDVDVVVERIVELVGAEALVLLLHAVNDATARNIAAQATRLYRFMDCPPSCSPTRAGSCIPNLIPGLKYDA